MTSRSFFHMFIFFWVQSYICCSLNTIFRTWEADEYATNPLIQTDFPRSQFVTGQMILIYSMIDQKASPLDKMSHMPHVSLPWSSIYSLDGDMTTTLSLASRFCPVATRGITAESSHVVHKAFLHIDDTKKSALLTVMNFLSMDVLYL